MTNAEIARALYELADALELGGGADAAFRVRALRQGARTIDGLADSVADRLVAGTLTQVRGIGEGIARRVEELVTTGKIADLDKLRARMSPGLVEVARVEGIGPKTADLFFRELGIASLDDLEAAAKAGRLRALPRIGPRKEEAILEAVGRARAFRGRVRLDRAEKEAAPFVDRLRALPTVARVELAGSVRRRRETVADVDILVDSSDAAAAMAAFVGMGLVDAVLAHGPTKASVKTRGGLQVDVRVVPAESFGAALHYFTGSKDHNVAIRALGVRRGLLINEYGVFEGRGDGPRIGGAEEVDVFRAVGLPWIPPELRENRGEIEAALAGKLPHLVEVGDLRGDLHTHTDETDGRNTLAEMVAAAAALGREYMAVTDHSQALKMVRGLDPERLRAQGRRIREMNERTGGAPRLLRGIEADILVDGSIDLGPEVLAELDWVIGSVHSHFQLPRAEQTARVVRAIESGLIDVLGHPTGRKIGERAEIDLDLEVVVDAARRCGVALEVNSYPDRLDLRDEHARLAIDRGAFVVIDTDAHATDHLRGLAYGVNVARRAWIEPRHVLNTRPLEGLLAHRADRRNVRS
jgi:DNA polymerase (family 10)